MPDLWLKSLRWFARVWALVFAGLILVLAAGDGFNPTKLSSKELLLTVPFFIAWLGLLLGWKWEGLGGILVVGGIAGFCIVHFVVTGFGRFPAGLFRSSQCPDCYICCPHPIFTTDFQASQPSWSSCSGLIQEKQGGSAALCHHFGVKIGYRAQSSAGSRRKSLSLPVTIVSWCHRAVCSFVRTQ